MQKQTGPIAASLPEPGIDRIGPTHRPAGKAIGYQNWSNLLFVHWRVPSAAIQALLPAGLTVDTWDGDAWVGLVPFAMSGIRPWWFPAVPGVSTFLETNVRTYVHVGGGNPGVWFFSLEAANSLAVRVARWRWHLPYHRADMSLARSGTNISYQSSRRWPGRAGAGNDIQAEIRDPLAPPAALPDWPQGQAVPGTFEHFLVERYLLYAQGSRGALLRGQVHHSPYPVREARLFSLEDTLLADAGIQPAGGPCHVAFSEGVNVEIFPLVGV